MSDREVPPLMRSITARESQVLTLIIRRLQDKEIASTLGIAPSTVNKYLRNLLLKLGASNRTQLAVSAVLMRLKLDSSAVQSLGIPLPPHE